jgi:hypothetical protein
MNVQEIGMPDWKHFNGTLKVREKTAGFDPDVRVKKVPYVVLLWRISTLFIFLLAPCMVVRSMTKSLSPAGFRVKYVHFGSVYIEGGSSSGLKEGQRLSIGRTPPGSDAERPEIIGEIELESVVTTASAGRIIHSESDIVPGDIALAEMKTPYEPQAGPAKRNVSDAALPVVSRQNDSKEEKKAQNSFSRNENRVRGRFSLDYSTLRMSDSEGGSSSRFGFSLRLDATRIAGTHWNVQGYYRGRLQSRTDFAGRETLTDLINRTYHLNIAYSNPESNWVFGAGRLYIPWASSLDTLDGFYLGRKFGPHPGTTTRTGGPAGSFTISNTGASRESVSAARPGSLFPGFAGGPTGSSDFLKTACS